MKEDYNKRNYQKHDEAAFYSGLHTRTGTRKILYGILEAAKYSPNAGNRQTTQIVVCTNQEINDTLVRIHRVLS
jgi:nitroreductase